MDYQGEIPRQQRHRDIGVASGVVLDDHITVGEAAEP